MYKPSIFLSIAIETAMTHVAIDQRFDLLLCVRTDVPAERVKGTGFSIEDGAHRVAVTVANQVLQSVAQYLSPFFHTG